VCSRRPLNGGMRPLKLDVSWHQMRFRPGTAIAFASPSPSSHFSGVFEGDGEAAYFYAYDRCPGAGILDAVHIYNVASFTDKGLDSEAEVRWSSDGLKCGLLINGQLQAIIDFESRVAYGRTNFPAPAGAWVGAARVPWREDLANLLA
jgi:hypothetical protein